MTEPGVDEDKRQTLRRFAAFGSLPLAGFADPDPDTTPLTREAIQGYLAETPGAHFSKLRDDLQLGTGETQHHLRTLTDDGAVECEPDGDYRRYYPADQFDDREKLLLAYLRRPTPRALLITLLRDPTTTPTGIAESIGVSRATVSTWAARLEEDDILDRSHGYSLVEPEPILVLLLRYADSFDENAVALADEAANFIEFIR